MLRKALPVTLAMAGVVALAPQAFAQSGSVERAVGGYTFEEAAQEGPETKNFNSNDGVLTFAIVTHTAGNGFFDPVYVGATGRGRPDRRQGPAARLGIADRRSGARDRDPEPDRPGSDARRPDHDHAAGRRLQRHRQGRRWRRASRSRPPTPSTARSATATAISHTGQDASAAAIAGEALVACLQDRGIKSGSILLPSSTAMGNIEVNNRVTSAFNAIVTKLQEAGKLQNFMVDAGPENTGIDTNPNDPVNGIISLFESRGDVVGAFAGNNVFTPALANAVAQMGKTGEICAYGFDLGPAQQEALRTGALTGALGQQPFLQGFWPVMQLYLQIDRGIAAANLDTRAQLVTGDNVELVGKRFEN